MSSLRDLHNKAMELAQLALAARHEGDMERATILVREASQFELQAADLVPDGESSEPTRSILYRSAASLAYQCKEFPLAQRLVAKALSGYPSSEVEQELKDLYEQITFEDHLRVRGIQLEDEEFQLSLKGSAVGFGMILYNEFVNRISACLSLVDRTVQRKMGRKYQRSGRPSEIYKPFTPALSTPRGSSFAITIRLASRTETEHQLPLMVTAQQIIDDIVAGLELLNESDESGLTNLIPDTAYHQHFIAHARILAPDGDNVTLVGFTSPRKTLGMTRQNKTIELVPQEVCEKQGDFTTVEVEGILDYAQSRKLEVIGLTTADNKEYTIVVTEGLDDLVTIIFQTMGSHHRDN